MPPLRAIPRGRGFTLIELLTVIAIVGILAAILIPVVGRVRDSARSATCLSNLRQLATASAMFGLDNKNRLPPAALANGYASYVYWPSILEPYLSANQRGNVFNGSASAVNYCAVGISNSGGQVVPNYGLNEKLIDYAQPNTLVPYRNDSTGQIVNGNTNWLGAKLTSIASPSRTILFADKVASSGSMAVDVRRNPTSANPPADAVAPRHGSSNNVNVAYVGGNVASVKLVSVYPEPTGAGNPWTRNNR